MNDVLFYVLIGLGVIILIAGIFVFAVSVKMARMKVSKEVGLLKRHLKYRPARPEKQYKIRD